MSKKRCYISGNHASFEIGESEVEFTCDCSIDNDGIGSYEYCGQKCFDAGYDYVVPDGEIEWNKGDFTAEENDIIEAFVKENEEKIADKIQENATIEKDEPDY